MVRNYPFFMFPIHYQFSIIHYPLKKEMKLNLKNPIVFFDLETTGTNINTDRIVEICYLKVYPNGNEETTSPSWQNIQVSLRMWTLPAGWCMTTMVWKYLISENIKECL